MQTVIIVIHLMIVAGLIGVVLLQKSEGGGLGIGGGGGGGFLSSRGTANVLTRTTAFLAAAFFATSLILSILAGYHRNPGSILQPIGGAPSAPSPGGPAAPLGQPGGGLLDQLQRQEQTAPAPAAPAPSGPQVPQSQ
ncbi:MAG: preprotein translocase subunit SecG [Alphaproteobacteria bacterium]|jgi:preprotein translocase subunit SecG|nr:preprotein translocase subunit SecG [Alphaproteobacteria bacterium]